MSTTDNPTRLPVPAEKGFHVFTTFRLDDDLSSNESQLDVCRGRRSNVYLLPYHLDRLRDAAATMTGFNVSESLEDFDSFERQIFDARGRLTEHHDGKNSTEVCRGKFSMWPDGRIDVSLVPVPQSSPILFPTSLDNYLNPMWTVILDIQATETSLFTEVKTSKRIDYDRARKSAGLTPSSNTEVLLYNYLGEVMDGSITSVYFYRDNEWVTPHHGGLEGVTRKFALDRELCSIAWSAVTKESLRPGEVVWLSNAFRGFFPAVFELR